MRQDLNKILAKVSRSFYLTIRVLPQPVREPVGLAYLLARTSDTVADSAGASPEARLQALRQINEALRGHASMPDLTLLAAGVADASERVLLGQAGTLLELLNATEPGDREEIIWVLEEIVRGQSLDVTRFACAGSAGIASLATAAELEDYTYSVAGCVGAFWTRLCCRRLRDYAPGIDPGELETLGVSFGKGLQLVNILRDAPADLANGRCYFPAEEMGGHMPEALSATPTLARPLYDRWSAQAGGHLEDGLRYIQAVRPWRLRLACFLPWALGVRTLRLMEHTRPLESPQRVKVTRKEVRRLLLLGAWAAMDNGALRVAAALLKM